MSVLASGIGSLPGADAAAFSAALRDVLDTLTLPYLPELPARAPGATMTGRALAVVAELGADLQPAGWRLTDAAGVDQRRARSLLAQDLDALEEHAQGYAGPLKVQVAGPWTLAATVERPRGDKVLADHGARRELAQALAEGVAAHVADVARRVPGASLVLQLDEPALPAVLAGRVPTASGFHRHRSVDDPAASPALEEVLDAAARAGATPIVHCCAPGVPVRLLAGAGARGLAVDLDVVTADDYDSLAVVLERGERVLLGVLPGTDPDPPPDEDAVTERVLRLLDMIGLAPAEAPGLTVSPGCGLAGSSVTWARRAHDLSARVARNLSTA